MSSQVLVRIVATAALCLPLACDSKRVELVAETDDEAADFGRTALSNAIVSFSESPKDPIAYARFARRVEEISGAFNRDIAKQAELRLSVLAVAPLQSGLTASHQEQMERFATTVWPSVLRFPAKDNEKVSDYLLRLCTGELALTCNNVVPEYWPVILNARVWRTLKSRVEVAYDRCQWCVDDPSFPDILDSVKQAHIRLEEEAQDAQEKGQPSSWPTAGANAADLDTSLILTFGSDGLVRLRGEELKGGNWREAIAKARVHEELLALHLRPQRMVGDLLELLKDAKRAGFTRVALVARSKHFPYHAKQYELRSSTTSFKDLGVHKGDSIQVLVQSLDFRAGKASGLPSR